MTGSRRPSPRAATIPTGPGSPARYRRRLDSEPIRAAGIVPPLVIGFVSWPGRPPCPGGGSFLQRALRVRGSMRPPPPRAGRGRKIVEGSHVNSTTPVAAGWLGSEDGPQPPCPLRTAG